jgi:hypothetical protein
MQFIEKNSFNIRSAVYRLGREDDQIEFILFPMIHIGEKAYYEEVQRRLAECDLIFLEGVKSKRASLLVYSYEVVGKIKRLDLVTQKALRLSHNLREKVFNPDIGTVEFDAGWSNIPLSTRVLLSLTLPFYVIYLYLWGTRNLLAENIALEDLASREEIIQQDENFDKLEDLIVDQRDQKLIDAIEKFRSQNNGEKKLVGIVYGARHMRTVTNFLLRELGYSVINAQWVTVFNL